jgi:diacylglycerol O-acyltransferase
MHRMHTLDAEFLFLEDSCSPMHIAGVSIFEGPPPARIEIEQLYGAKLAGYPCYRQRVRSLPLGLGRPRWADDPHFELGYHLRWTALPAPHDEAALATLVGRIMSQLLDRERPLWECWVVEGLTGGRWALVSKVHHALVDGISGVGLFASLLSEERESAAAPCAARWSPQPEPSRRALLQESWSDLRSDATPWLRALADSIRHPRERGRAVRDVAGGLGRLIYGLRTGPKVSLQGKVGLHRGYGMARASVEDLQRIRRTLGGTVNDVVLAVLSGAFRALLMHRGDAVERGPIRALVPMSIRSAARQSTLDNQVAALFCDLPVHLADPVERLHWVHAQMSALKTSHVAEATGWLLGVGDLVPAVLMGSLTRAIARLMHRIPQRSFVTVATHVQGPRVPLYLLGRKMLAYYPYVPITQGARVGTAILTYDGQVTFGVTADQDSVPEVDLFVRALSSSLLELLARSGQEVAKREQVVIDRE